MKLAFIEPLLYTSSFFSVYLLEIGQAQPKNSNRDVRLSAWLISI